MKLLLAAVMAALALHAQSDADALKLAARATELMDASSLAIPELARGGAPLTEAARQAVDVLRTAPGNPLAVWYRFLSNLRAFLLVSDAVPKPAAIGELPRQQLTELRDVEMRVDAYFQGLLERAQNQLRSPDRDDTARYREANSRLGPVQPGKPRVVFLGDSITDFWRLNEYFPDRDFVNRGISGQITGQMLGRFRQDVIELKPAAVVILAGTNDIARGAALPTIESNLTAMADLADYYKIKVIFASVLPVSDYHRAADPQFERTRERPLQVIIALNNWISEMCRQRGYAYLNYWPALADQAGLLKPDLSDDGLHPSSAGYRMMAAVALEAIDKTVSTLKPPGSRRRP